jgi:hypothetical protein
MDETGAKGHAWVETEWTGTSFIRRALLNEPPLSKNDIQMQKHPPELSSWGGGLLPEVSRVGQGSAFLRGINRRPITPEPAHFSRVGFSQTTFQKVGLPRSHRGGQRDFLKAAFTCLAGSQGLTSCSGSAGRRVLAPRRRSTEARSKPEDPTSSSSAPPRVRSLPHLLQAKPPRRVNGDPLSISTRSSTTAPDRDPSRRGKLQRQQRHELE